MHENSCIFRVVPESPRWLLTQGRVEDAEKTLDAIAHVNHGRPLAEPIKLRPIMNRWENKEAGLWDIIKHGPLRRRTLNNIYTWLLLCYCISCFSLSLYIDYYKTCSSRLTATCMFVQTSPCKLTSFRNLSVSCRRMWTCVLP